MKRLAIIGASGHGKVVAELAELLGWTEIVFFDDAFPQVNQVEVWTVRGKTEDLWEQITDFDGCIVAIGNNLIRRRKTQDILINQGNLVSLIHPSSSVSKYTVIEAGSVVMAGAIINPFSKIGSACIVNTLASIDHDCVLADGVHISPGVNLAGAVKIGQQSWIGIGASVKQSISIGDDVIVGAGAVVVSDVAKGLVVVGIPAKVKNIGYKHKC